MSAPMLLQALVIALVVGWSLLFATHRLLPVASRRAQARFVEALDKRALPHWLRVAVQRMQPRSSSGGSCGDGCSSCGGCATVAKPVEALPLVFRPRRKS